MYKKGEANLLAILVVFLTLVVLGLGVTTIWSLSRASTTQAAIDAHKAEAASAAREDQKVLDEADFKEREKLPFRTYEAAQVLGGISVEYPKTWSVYAKQDESGDPQLDLFMHPKVVHAEDSTQAFAFRLQLSRNLYTDVIEEYQGKVEDGELTSKVAKVSGLSGLRFDGIVSEGHQGSLVVLPLRDKSVIIWTESPDHVADFDKILKDISLSP